jgi:O-antigen/teichoic acid export membrane protein
LKLVWLDIPLFKKMVSFGFPVTVTSLSYTLFQQTTILILTYFGTLEEVGLLNVALPTSALLINLSTAISFVLFPMASELSARGLKGHLQEGVKILYKYSFICIVPICLVLVAYPGLIISLLFGDKFVSASGALVILALGSIFWTIANINFTTLAAIGKSKEPLKIMSAVIAVSVVLGLILIPLMGLKGAAISVGVSYVVAMIISTFLIHRHVEVKIKFDFWLKNFVAGALFISTVHLAKGVLYLNKYVEAVATLLFAGGVYLLALLIMRLISVEEIKNNLLALLRRNE